MSNTKKDSDGGQRIVRPLKSMLAKFGAQSTKDMPASVAFEVVSTVESVTVRATDNKGLTIETTVYAVDAERVLVQCERGVPHGVPSSTTLTLPGLE